MKPQTRQTLQAILTVCVILGIVINPDDSYTLDKWIPMMVLTKAFAAGAAALLAMICRNTRLDLSSWKWSLAYLRRFFRL